MISDADFQIVLSAHRGACEALSELETAISNTAQQAATVADRLSELEDVMRPALVGHAGLAEQAV